MKSNIVIPTKDNIIELSLIQSIHEIRGVRVMLDFDLAKRYEVETRRLKEQVRRNIERFPSDFMFQLSKQEWKELVANCDKLEENIKHSPTTPFAFTREGIAMLSGVLHSNKAIKTNIDIMRAFIAVYQYALNYAELKREMEIYMNKTDKEINDIHTILNVLISHKKELEKPRNPIGFRQNKE